MISFANAEHFITDSTEDFFNPKRPPRLVKKVTQTCTQIDDKILEPQNWQQLLDICHQLADGSYDARGTNNALSDILMNISERHKNDNGILRIGYALLNTFRFVKGESEGQDNGQILAMLGEVAKNLPTNNPQAEKLFELIRNTLSSTLQNSYQQFVESKNQDFEKAHTVVSALSGLSSIAKTRGLRELDLDRILVASNYFDEAKALLLQKDFNFLENSKFAQKTKEFRSTIQKIASSVSEKNVSEIKNEVVRAIQGELKTEILKLGVDVAGIFDPSPICDGLGVCLAVKEGDWVGAGMSLLSMAPYLGDTIAKPLKITKAVRKVSKLLQKLAYYSQKAKRAKAYYDSIKNNVTNSEKVFDTALNTLFVEPTRKNLPRLGREIFDVFSADVQKSVKEACYHFPIVEKMQGNLKDAFKFTDDMLTSFQAQLSSAKNRFLQLFQTSGYTPNNYQLDWRIWNTLSLNVKAK
jgi:formaldehyde-activating enzyme involved in methanogenesis